MISKFFAFLVSIPSPSPPPLFFNSWLWMYKNKEQCEIETDICVLFPVTWPINFLRGCFVILDVEMKIENDKMEDVKAKFMIDLLELLRITYTDMRQ